MSSSQDNNMDFWKMDVDAMAVVIRPDSPISESSAGPSCRAIEAPPPSRGPQLFMGMPGSEGQGTTSSQRHSIAMKLRLRQIEQNWSRLLRERVGLAEVKQILLETRAKLCREGEHLEKMTKLAFKTANQNMSSEEWEQFFQQYFLVNPDQLQFEDFNGEDDGSEADSDAEELSKHAELDLD